MSFLTEAAARRMAMTSRVAMVQAPRQFSTTIPFHKSATDTVKDTLKTTDRKVSDKLVDGINATTAAAQKVTGSDVGGGKQAGKSPEEMRSEEKSKKTKST